MSVTGVNHDQNEAPAGDDRTVDPKSVVAGDVVSQKADKPLKALPAAASAVGGPVFVSPTFPPPGAP